MKYPKEIFVAVEKDGKETYLVAHDNKEDVEEGSVGIYELKKVAKKTTKVTIQ